MLKFSKPTEIIEMTRIGDNRYVPSFSWGARYYNACEIIADIFQGLSPKDYLIFATAALLADGMFGLEGKALHEYVGLGRLPENVIMLEVLVGGVSGISMTK